MLNGIKQSLGKLISRSSKAWRLSPSSGTTSQTQGAKQAPKNPSDLTRADVRQKTFVEFNEPSADISKDFLRQGASGVTELFCERPWRRLEVKVRDNRTKVCCDFAVKLPLFQWPTIEEFHDEKHMWNHPFMQHMRRSMGMPNEIPYCKLCLTTNKRASKNQQAREEARQATVDIYNIIEMDILKRSYRGRISQFEHTLEDYVYSFGTTIRKNVFNKPPIEYRKMVKQRGFIEIGDILQIGGLGVLSPFLAEANRNLTVADFTEPQVSFASNLLKDFDLEGLSSVLAAHGSLPFDDESFDGVWLAGQYLYGSNRMHFLSEIRRVLRPEGKLFIRSAYGAGELVNRILNDPTGSAGQNDDTSLLPPQKKDCLKADYIKNLNAMRNLDAREAAMKTDAILARNALLKGLNHDGLANFMSSKKIGHILKKAGFGKDLAYPEAVFPYKPNLENDLLTHCETDEDLSKALRIASGQGNGLGFDPKRLETQLNISAIKAEH